MITIAVCDDDELWRKQIQKNCRDYLNSTGQEYKIIEFQSGEEVLEYQGDKVLLLFLDIQMQGMTGLEVMEKLRKKDLFWRIVFVSSYEEFRIDTIDLKTLAFFPKPFEELAIIKCLQTAIRENNENIAITVRGIQGDCDVKIDEILYVQAQKNYVDIHLQNVDFTGYDSIGYMDDKLRGTTILRVHKSYLINLQYVVSINRDEAKMTNGVRIPVGRTYYPKLKKAYSSFLRSVTIERIRKE